METLGAYPGLPGLFIAGVLSASLSTVSSVINSIATVILEDIYKPMANKKTISDKKEAILSKLLCKFVY